MTELDAEVIVVGAGPTGLLLAGDLARAGIDVTVLERRATEANLSRAFVVHARALELLDARGVADELIGTGRVIEVMQLFGGFDLDLTRLPSRFPYLLSTPQYNTERVLEDRARRLGARIERGAEVVGLSQDRDTAEVRLRSGKAVRARYVVGADGVRSAVREALDLPYAGHSAIRSVMLADVRVTEEPERDLVLRICREGFSFMASFGDGWYRVIAWDLRHQVPEEEPLELAEVREITKLAFGTDFGMYEPRWLSRFHSDERQVPEYRVGRVFVAGDAAHCHVPAGGQGMNTGLGDAANLGWKLAAVLRGRAPEKLLDSYDLERHPFGEQVIENSGILVTLGLGRKLWHRVARRVIPVVAGNIRPIEKRLSETMSQLGFVYSAPHNAHHLVGRRAPDLRLATGGGSRLYEALRGGRFVYVGDGVGQPPADWDGQVDVVRPAIPGEAAAPALLVRPDAYVAWASDSTGDTPRLEAVLAQMSEANGRSAASHRRSRTASGEPRSR